MAQREVERFGTILSCFLELMVFLNKRLLVLKPGSWSSQLLVTGRFTYRLFYLSSDLHENQPFKTSGEASIGENQDSTPLICNLYKMHRESMAHTQDYAERNHEIVLSHPDCQRQCIMLLSVQHKILQGFLYHPVLVSIPQGRKFPRVLSKTNVFCPQSVKVWW